MQKSSSSHSPFSRASRVRHPARSRPAVFAMDCEGDGREEAQKTQDPQRQDDALKQAQVLVVVLVKASSISIEAEFSEV